MHFGCVKKTLGHFPRGPVVRTPPSNAGGVGWGWGGYDPTCLMPKNQNVKQKQNCNKLN